MIRRAWSEMTERQIKAIINRLVAAGGGNVVPTGAGTLKTMGLISNASAAAILSNANAGMLSIVKFTPRLLN